MLRRIVLSILSFTFLIQAQQESFIKQSLVVNVEIPVRVYQGDNFLEDLTLKDFEVFEDGLSQKIEAVYLINERSIERSEEKKRFNPELERNFFLFFELADYSPRIGDAVRFFINDIITPGDNLLVTTPLMTYRLKGKSLEFLSRAKIVQELIDLIRGDVWKGNADYRETLSEIEQAAQALAAELSQGNEPLVQVERDTRDPVGGFQHRLMYYSQLLSQLENLRYADQFKMLDFANYLKSQSGQKYVFMFYQKEFIPQIDPRILSQYLESQQDNYDIVMKITEMMGLSRRDLNIDTDKIKQAYADASTSIHFLFYTPTPPPAPGVQLEERSEDIFSAFYEISQATGGIMLSSANPKHDFQKALDASNKYYLLYYSPKDYSGAGEYKKIEVRVKQKGLRIYHRTGYFAY